MCRRSARQACPQSDFVAYDEDGEINSEDGKEHSEDGEIHSEDSEGGRWGEDGEWVGGTWSGCHK